MRHHIYAIYVLVLLISASEAPGPPASSAPSNLSKPKETESNGLFTALNERFNLLPPDYNAFDLPPTENGGPPEVYLYLEIFETPVMNEMTEEISLEIFVNMEWRDGRLRTPQNRPDTIMFTIGPKLYNKIWLPDIYLGINKKYILKPPITSSNHLESELSVTSQGRVFYTARLTPTVGCKMDFTRYPSDLQTCSFDFFGDTPDKGIHLKWSGSEILYRGGFDTPNHRVGFMYRKENDTFVLRGRDIGASVTTFFRRKVGYHVLQTYVPSGLIVLVTWLSLFIPIERGAERMMLSTTTLLTLTALFGSVRMTSPCVSYVKALDIWMATCCVAVFLIMAENIAILNFSHGKVNRKLLRSSKIMRDGVDSVTGCFSRRGRLDFQPNEENAPVKPGFDEREVLQDSSTKEEVLQDKHKVLLIAARRLDYICRLVLILLFVAFTLSFALWLYSGERIPIEASRQKFTDIWF